MKYSMLSLYIIWSSYFVFR